MMLLVDIGNSRVHIYDGEVVTHLSHDDLIDKYRDMDLYYICVSIDMLSKISDFKNWHNISNVIHITGEYETMGLDRKALCMSYDNGVFVDAGSAITVDLVRDGVYRGGFILLGIGAYIKAYWGISEALKVDFNPKCSLKSMPLTTKDSVSYGIISSIKSAIDSHSGDLPLYFTGGDGEWLSGFFSQSIFDELLVFRGLQKALKGNI